jgi:hypothetical protein
MLVILATRHSQIGSLEDVVPLRKSDSPTFRKDMSSPFAGTKNNLKCRIPFCDVCLISHRNSRRRLYVPKRHAAFKVQGVKTQHSSTPS